MSRDGAIGIFDSGIGGLTVARAIAQALPRERLVYLGDTARLPYGNKSGDTVVRYALRNVRFLTDNALKAVVVACNTVSAVALPAIREMVSVPVIGVIGPGALVAAARSAHGIIGVIGQPGTIASGKYESNILRARPDAHVYSRPTPLLVPLAEEGWMGTEVARLVLVEYLKPLAEAGIDTLVLGCTHYPLFKAQIAEIFHQEFGRDVVLVDSAESVAATLVEMFARDDFSPSDAALAGIRCFVTDSPTTFQRVGKQFWGEDFPQVIQVDL
ncbi:MAG: glutamate racemase [Pseudomonadota bacterium]